MGTLSRKGCIEAPLTSPGIHDEGIDPLLAGTTNRKLEVVTASHRLQESCI